jgi:hypothetical protein
VCDPHARLCHSAVGTFIGSPHFGGASTFGIGNTLTLVALLSGDLRLHHGALPHAKRHDQPRSRARIARGRFRESDADPPARELERVFERIRDEKRKQPHVSAHEPLDLELGVDARPRVRRSVTVSVTMSASATFLHEKATSSSRAHSRQRARKKPNG